LYLFPPEVMDELKRNADGKEKSYEEGNPNE
jgi:hypothetical protein